MNKLDCLLEISKVCFLFNQRNLDVLRILCKKRQKYLEIYKYCLYFHLFAKYNSETLKYILLIRKYIKIQQD